MRFIQIPQHVIVGPLRPSVPFPVHSILVLLYEPCITPSLVSCPLFSFCPIVIYLFQGVEILFTFHIVVKNKEKKHKKINISE